MRLSLLPSSDSEIVADALSLLGVSYQCPDCELVLSCHPALRVVNDGEIPPRGLSWIHFVVVRLQDGASFHREGVSTARRVRRRCESSVYYSVGRLWGNESRREADVRFFSATRSTSAQHHSASRKPDSLPTSTSSASHSSPSSRTTSFPSSPLESPREL